MDTTAQVVPSDLFVHVRIIMSVVVGFGLTRLLALLGRIVQHPTRARVYWVHLLWVVSMIITLIHFWWWEFSLATITWSFEIYAFLIFYASLYYFVCVLLSPDDSHEYAGYEDYFISRRRWIFGFIALTELVDLIDTAIKGRVYIGSLGPEYYVRLVVYVALALVAMTTPSRRFHAVFAVANLVYQISFILRLYDTFE